MFCAIVKQTWTAFDSSPARGFLSHALPVMSGQTKTTVCAWFKFISSPLMGSLCDGMTAIFVSNIIDI